MLLKSDRNFDSALVNVILEHVPCGFVITFSPEVLRSMTKLSMRIWSSQGKFCLREHVPIGGSIFDVDCHVVKFLQLEIKIIL